MDGVRVTSDTKMNSDQLKQKGKRINACNCQVQVSFRHGWVQDSFCAVSMTWRQPTPTFSRISNPGRTRDFLCQRFLPKLHNWASLAAVDLAGVKHPALMQEGVGLVLPEPHGLRREEKGRSKQSKGKWSWSDSWQLSASLRLAPHQTACCLGRASV